MSPFFSRLTVFSAAGFFLLAMPAFADATARTISVSGQGEVRAVPDEALLSAGVETNARSAAAALAQNTKAMNAVFATLRRAGIADKDIQTSDFSVSPQYSNDKTPQHVTGYRVGNSVSVTVEDLSKLGATLDALVSSGANNLGDSAFAIRDPKPLLAKARAAAVADAISRAQVLARAAGVTLGPVMSISENSGFESPRPMMAMAMRAVPSAVPVAAGQESVTASVSMTWEIR
jgi:uncharacterized protein